MPRHLLSDATDPRLEGYRDLRADRERRGDPTFICEGALCVERALGSGLAVRSVLTTASQLERLAIPADVEVLVTDSALLREITGFKFHRGVLAEVARPSLLPPDFAPLAARRQSTVVFAEGVANPSNLGALMRNARSFGVDLMVVTPSSADPFTRRAVRTAMGTSFLQPVAVAVELAPVLAAYRLATGGEVVAASLSPRARPLAEYRRPPHVAVVFGSEGDGLLPMTARAADAELTIAMAPGSDSLNVAAASAVFLYQLGWGAGSERS